MRIAVGGFTKYLRKSPPDDNDIREALQWVQDMVTAVLVPVEHDCTCWRNASTGARIAPNIDQPCPNPEHMFGVTPETLAGVTE